MAVAFCGTVICGTSGKPWALVRVPLASTCSWPARVKAGSPFGRRLHG